MIRHLKHVLRPEETAYLNELARHLRFVDGRATNSDSSVKHNLQISHGDPAASEPGLILRDALMRHADLRAFSMPKQMARPTMARYEPGMTYGWHVDEAMFPSNPPMRSDLSCTVWLSEPETYDGGELVIQLGEQQLSFKGRAGDAVLYPSTTIHQVAPITRGQRLVGITWIQSYVAESSRRELLLQLEEAKAIALAGQRDQRLLVLLESVRTNLYRQWADT